MSPHPALEISVLTLRWSQGSELVETATDGALAEPAFQIETRGPMSPNILRKEPGMQRKPVDRNVHHRIIYMHTRWEIAFVLNVKSYDISLTESTYVFVCVCIHTYIYSELYM